MKLIADSGSTKTDWVVIQDDQSSIEYSTMGFNPFMHTAADIVAGIGACDGLMAVADEVQQVFFYGAGCSNREMIGMVEDALSTVFSRAAITVRHDVEAAAYATYSGEIGVSCILGTGSNSCLFDGKDCKEVIPSLGYILGDEGSGTHFGKCLLRDFLYKKMPKEIEADFREKYHADKQGILENVLSKKEAKVYIASFAAFMADHRESAYVQQMLFDGFVEFLSYHVQCFQGYVDMPVHFVGSIAYFYQEELKKSAASLDIQIGNIIRKPIHGLVSYHQA